MKVTKDEHLTARRGWDDAPVEYQDLLDDISLGVSGKVRDTHSEPPSGEFIWEGKIFRDYFGSMPDAYLEEFKRSFKKANVQYETFRDMHKKGLSAASAKKVLILSKHSQNKDWTALLRELAEYCEQLDFEPIWQPNHESLIKKLKSNVVDDNYEVEAQKPVEQEIVHPPKLIESLFEQNIDRDLDVVRKAINFPPYGGDSFERPSKRAYELALHKANKILEQSPSCIEAMYIKSIVLGRLEEVAPSLALSEELYENHPESYYAIVAYVVALTQSKQRNKAIETYDLAKGVRPLDGTLEFIIGQNLAAAGYLENAEQHFLNSIDIDKDRIRPFYSLAYSYVEREEYAKAKSILCHARKVFPKNDKITKLLVNTELKSGSFLSSVWYRLNLSREAWRELIFYAFFSAKVMSARSPKRVDKIVRDAWLRIESDTLSSAGEKITAYSRIRDEILERTSRLPLNQKIRALFYAMRCNDRIHRLYDNPDRIRPWQELLLRYAYLLHKAIRKNDKSRVAEIAWGLGNFHFERYCETEDDINYRTAINQYETAIKHGDGIPSLLSRAALGDLNAQIGKDKRNLSFLKKSLKHYKAFIKHKESETLSDRKEECKLMIESINREIGNFQKS